MLTKEQRNTLDNTIQRRHKAYCRFKTALEKKWLWMGKGGSKQEAQLAEYSFQKAEAELSRLLDELTC